MSLATLSIDLEARLAKLQEGMDKAERIAAKTAAGIEARWGKLGSLASGLGVGIVSGFSTAAITAFTRATVDSLDALNDVSDATGATVENLSALEDVARRNGGTLDDVAGILVKFNAGLKEADGKNGVSRALQAIGVNAAQLKKEDPAEALRQVAVALSGFADDGNKARIVQELFGKSIKEAGPYLKDLAEQGRLNATVTSEQAEEAERFNKELYALQTNAGNFARALTGEVIPSLNAFFAGFRKGGLKGAFDEFGETVGLGKAYYEFRNNVKPLQAEVESLQGTIATLKTTIKADPTNPALPAILDARTKELVDAQKKLADARDKYLRLNDGSAGGGRGFVNPDLVKPGLPGQKDPEEEKRQALRQAALARLDASIDKIASDFNKRVEEWNKRNDEALDKLDENMAEGFVNPMNKVMDEWQERNQEALDKFDEKTIQAIEDAATRGRALIEDQLGSGLYDALNGNFDNIGKSFGDLIKRLIAQSLAADITGKLFGNVTGNTQGSFLSSLVGFFAGGRASGGPTSPGKMYEVNEGGAPELLEYGGRNFLLSGKGSGYVRPLTAGGGAGGGTVISNDTYHIGQGVSAGQVAAAIKAANSTLEARIYRRMREGAPA